MEEQINNEQEVKVEEKTHKPFKKYIGIGLGVITLCAIAYFVVDALKFQTTDDAYVETTTVQVAPRVSGQITEVFIKDNQQIKEGDIIAKIDTTDYEIALDKADAAYERMLLGQQNAKANLAASQSNIALAKKDLDRYTQLYADGAVSKQTLDAAQAKYDSALANKTRSEQALLSGDGQKVADADLKEAKETGREPNAELKWQIALKKMNAGTNVQTAEAGSPSNRESKQDGEEVDFAHLAGLDNYSDRRTRPRLDKCLVHRGDRQKRWDAFWTRDIGRGTR